MVLDPGQRLILRYTDAFLATSVTDELRHEMLAAFTPAQLVELGVGIALFHGFSKMLIVLGLEPEQMNTTILPTPDIAL